MRKSARKLPAMRGRAHTRAHGHGLLDLAAMLK